MVLIIYVLFYLEKAAIASLFRLLNVSIVLSSILLRFHKKHQGGNIIVFANGYPNKFLQLEEIDNHLF